MIQLRSATVNDADRLLQIYAYYVKETAVSFEYDVPSVDEFKARIQKTLQNFPYLVLEENGIVQGYAYAGPFHSRAAYSHCNELSIYIDRHARRRGFGRMLYSELEKILQQKGIRNLYACIASTENEDAFLTNDSERFHARLGFTKVGEFHQCGFKFNRWYNMIWMEKRLDSPAESKTDRTQKGCST